MTRTHFVLGAALGLAATGLGACAKRAPASDSPGSADHQGATAAEASPDEDGAPLDDLHRQLLGLEDQLLDEGIPLPGHDEYTRDAATPASEPAARCTRICELTAAICELQDGICDLAASHPGQARYTDACTRAQSDCRRAQEACSDCTDPA